MSKPKKFFERSRFASGDNHMPPLRCVMIPLSASVFGIDQQNRGEILYKSYIGNNFYEYMTSRKISDNWREMFAKWGYVPCVD